MIVMAKAFLEKEGRGIVDHFKLQGRVDFEVGSFSKALGVQGGILAGKEIVRTHALNHSRSWLLSGSQPPGVAAAQKAAIEVLMNEPEHHKKLWENTEYFRSEMQSMGFDTGVSTTPIIPVMCGESSVAKVESATHARRRDGWCDCFSYGCQRQSQSENANVNRSFIRRFE